MNQDTPFQRDALNVAIMATDPIDRRLLAHLIGGLGYQVTTVKHENQLAATINDKHVDLLLIDAARAPDGALFYMRHLQQLCPNIGTLPIIVCCARIRRGQIAPLLTLTSGIIISSDLYPETMDGRIQAALKREFSSVKVPTITDDKNLPIPAADLSWMHRPEYQPIDEATIERACAAHLDIIEQFSPAITMLFHHLGSPDPSVDHIHTIINLDHGLALKLIKVANSSAYGRGFGKDVSTIREALMLIGIKQLRQILLTMELIGSFTNNPPDEAREIGTFWEHAIAVAILACAIGNTLNHDDTTSDTLFMAGMFHDIGKLCLLHAALEHYGTFVSQAEVHDTPLEVIERHFLPRGHEFLARPMLNHYGYNPAIAECIELHHQPLAAIRASKQATNAIILTLADRIAHALMIGYSGNEYLRDLDPLIAALQLDIDSLNETLAELPNQALELKLALLNTRPGAEWSQYDLTVLKNIRGIAHPIVFSRARLEPLTLFCSRLNPLAADPVPNIALLSIADEAEASAMIEELLAYEQSIDRTLPVLIISPLEHIDIASHNLPRSPDRRIRAWRTPVSTQRLTVLIEELLRTPATSAT
ncbi:MAG: HDOD domain-containing protein [Planctomycetota bacterium]|jgi:HD-like signal output (HDOD) protein/CheY-like chemotaxis protein